MDYERVFWVVCLTVLIVVGFNLVIYIGFRRDKSSLGMAEALRRAAQQAKNPWEAEDASLSELSRLVGQLKPGEEKKQGFPESGRDEPPSSD
jgi:hypothetical protein